MGVKNAFILGLVLYFVILCCIFVIQLKRVIIQKQKAMSKIKLVIVNRVNETLCCKSQLYINRGTCDFAINNGELFSWNGCGWSKSNSEFEIVDKIEKQEL